MPNPVRPYRLIDDPTTKKLEELLRAHGRLEREIGYLRAMVKRKWRDSFVSAKLDISSFYIPAQDLTNYSLPGAPGQIEFYGYEVKYSQGGQNGLFGNDTTHHRIADPLGMSCVMPGDVIMCRKNPHAVWNTDHSTESAWEPFPGQGLMRPARTYKTIPARDFVTGDQIHFVNPFTGADILELSEISIAHSWATSDVEIFASQSDPHDLWLYYASNNQSSHEWFVVGRECNPTSI